MPGLCRRIAWARAKDRGIERWQGPIADLRLMLRRGGVARR
jgi:hypothetical protein